jgi:TubC N-terminal docking domain
MSTVWSFILGLRLRAVSLTLVGNELEIIAPAGALTESEREKLRRRKPEIIETLVRRLTIDERVRAAIRTAEMKLGPRINFSTDTPQARNAERHLEECMGAYIEGTGSIEAVQGAFKSWIHTLEVETTPL